MSTAKHFEASSNVSITLRCQVRRVLEVESPGLIRVSASNPLGFFINIDVHRTFAVISICIVAIVITTITIILHVSVPVSVAVCRASRSAAIIIISVAVSFSVTITTVTSVVLAGRIVATTR